MMLMNLSARTNHLTVSLPGSILITALDKARALANATPDGPEARSHAAQSSTYGHVAEAVIVALTVELGSREDASDVYEVMMDSGVDVHEALTYLNDRRRAQREEDAAEAGAWGPCPRCGVTGLIVEDHDPSVAHCDVCGTTSWR